MKIALLTSALVMAAFVCFLAVAGCASLGVRPDKAQQAGFKTSRQFHAKEGVFDNRVPGLHEKVMERLGIFETFTQWLRAEDASPQDEMPFARPDLSKFAGPSENLRIIWFGHSSFMLNLNGAVILVDPVFSSYASPVFFLNRRFQNPPVRLEDLPEVDIVVISHDHYDHLDMDSIRFFKDKKTRFLTPLGVGGHLRSWGIASERITELDWWQGATLMGVEFIATPAQHFSGRSFRSDETLWASWVMRSKGRCVFYSGDTGYDEHFSEIGKKYGPFDVAFLECGQYNPKWREVHMLPDDTARAYKDLGADRLFPVHWGMFQLSVHPWDEPVSKLYEMHQKGQISLMAPRLGEVVEAAPQYQISTWWKAGKNRAE